MSKNAKREYIKFSAEIGEPLGVPGGWLSVRKALSYLPSHRISDVLDLGANLGVSTHVVADQFPLANVTGVEIAEESVAIAKQSVAKGKKGKGRLRFEQADAEHLPFSNESFDLVFSGGAFAFMDDPSAAIAESARVLKHDGFLVAVELFYPGRVDRKLSAEIKSTIGIPAERHTLEYWLSCFSHPKCVFEGVEQVPVAALSKKLIALRVAQAQERFGGRLGQGNSKGAADRLGRYLSVFAKNNKHLMLGIFVARKRGLSLVGPGDGAGHN